MSGPILVGYDGSAASDAALAWAFAEASLLRADVHAVLAIPLTTLAGSVKVPLDRRAAKVGYRRFNEAVRKI